MTLLLLWISLAAAECPEPTSRLDLERALARLDKAFAEIDTESLRQAQAQVDAVIPCLQEELDPSLSASLHRGRALFELDANNRAAAEQAFSAARAIEPSHQLRADIATDTVLQVYLARDPANGRTAPLPLAAQGRVELDGSPADKRPLERPVVFQHIDDKGAIQTTAYLLPGEPLPTYLAKDSEKRAKIRRALLISGASGLGTSAVCLGSAALIRSGPFATLEAQTADGPSLQETQRAERLTSLNHTLAGGGSAIGLLSLGALGLGLGVQW